LAAKVARAAETEANQYAAKAKAAKADADAAKAAADKEDSMRDPNAPKSAAWLVADASQKALAARRAIVAFQSAKAKLDVAQAEADGEEAKADDI